MLAFFSLVFAVVPMVAFLFLVWGMDRYEREPLWLVFKNFLWGAFGAVVFGVAGSEMFRGMISGLVTSARGIELAESVMIAPFVEEITKGGFLLLVTMRQREFDGVSDGFVYGAAIGLGFGMTENFMYYLGAETLEAWVILVLVRTFFSAVMHSMATGTFGAFVGFAKFRPTMVKWVLIPLGLGVAMFMHIFWNLTVSFGETAILGFLFILFGVMAITTVLQISLLLESRMIKMELTEESQNGLIPPEHLNFLPYTRRRHLIGWYPPYVDQKQYIKLATKLAFKKHESRNCPSRKREPYLQEVESLRVAIGKMLRPGMLAGSV